MNAAAPDYRALATGLDIRTRAWIDGRFVDACSGQTFEVTSPIDGRRLGAAAKCEAGDVDAAVRASRRAFEDGRWSRERPSVRKKVLVRWAELLQRHAQELAILETLDVGKPISDSLAVDLPATISCLAWYGEAIDKLYGEIAPTGGHALGLVSREPVGVVGAVTPWNFPLLMAMWKLAPALAAGNSVVLKPAEQSPLTAIRIAELAAEAGLPAGVLNIVPGFGDAGRAIGLHDDIDAVAFTGSTEVGKLFHQYAGQSNLKSVSVECGGKSPNIVFADCPDLEAAARAAAVAIYFNQGETCSAGSRLLVQRPIADAFVEAVAKAGAGMAPGDPLDPKTVTGAMISEAHMGRVLGFIRDGEASGARRVSGGRRVREETGGFYIEPTLFDDVDPASPLAREEIFGPVLATTRFDTVVDAVRLANDTRYGLAAGVWTRDLKTAHRVSRDLRAGTVWVNNYDESDITVPFGGYRESGHGRDKSLHAIDKYTQLKTTWISLA